MPNSYPKAKKFLQKLTTFWSFPPVNTCVKRHRAVSFAKPKKSLQKKSAVTIPCIFLKQNCLPETLTFQHPITSCVVWRFKTPPLRQKKRDLCFQPTTLTPFVPNDRTISKKRLRLPDFPQPYPDTVLKHSF